ncbi:MAG: hypothetical protein K2X38_14780 [Gemmataceae bacterium]|nr:hypothetical protein [Gemmataceae bacterium]
MRSLRHVGSMLLGAFCLAAFVFTAARAQDEPKEKNVDEKRAFQALMEKAETEYRVFFKKPESGVDFWAAIQFEMELGKFDLAALHLKQLLEKEPKEPIDADLVKIHENAGMSAFLRLQRVQKWSEVLSFQKEATQNVEKLVDRVTAAVDKHLGNAQRIRRFISRLDAETPEERAFAFAELDKSRERVAPYLVEALRKNVGKPLYPNLIDAMVRFGPEVMAPMLEVFKARSADDANEVDLRLALLQIAIRRGEKRVVPYLWHMSESKKYPQIVRERAKEALGLLLDSDPKNLAPAKVMLVQQAEKYFTHNVRFRDPKGVRLWPWDGTSVANTPIELRPDQAEEFFGLRYSREALELDPTYVPAQTIFLNFTLERTYLPRWDKFLIEPSPPQLQQLLATIQAELLLSTLDRALEDRNVPIILPIVQALGDRGEGRAVRLSASGAPQGLLRALYYPDTRVQTAAVRAFLKMPGTQAAAAKSRVVEVLARQVALEGSPKALVIGAPGERNIEYRKGLKETGLEPVFAPTLNKAFEKMREGGEFHAIFVDQSVKPADLNMGVTQVRADPDFGRLPIFVFAAKQNIPLMERTAERHRYVRVLPDIWLEMAEELRNAVFAALQKSSGPPLTAEERQVVQKNALDLLWRMSRAEIAGYDIRPAQEGVTRLLQKPEPPPEALEILSRLPGAPAQIKLADFVLDPAHEKMRLPAAIELNRHVQKHGLLLPKTQIDHFRIAYKSDKLDPPIKSQVALMFSVLRPTVVGSGRNMLQFEGVAPPAPKDAPKEKEKEKEKDN